MNNKELTQAIESIESNVAKVNHYMHYDHTLEFIRATYGMTETALEMMRDYLYFEFGLRDEEQLAEYVAANY